MAHNQARYRRKNQGVILFTLLLGLILLGVMVAVILFFLSLGRQELSDSGVLPGVSGDSGAAQSPYVERRPGQVIPTWTGTERITVLVLGIDEREQEGGPFRTDTMMLLTLNPVTLEAGMLSIPRDLWVPIPGYSDGRINTAHFLGDLYDYQGSPAGGPGLAMDTVEYNLGVPVDYYVRLNFQGFIDLIDLIGGINIHVERPIRDNAYPTADYGTEVLVIEPGLHHFDGEMALKYARTRHGSSDFDRARRQQQVLLAILDRVTNLGMLPQLATRAGDIFATVDDSLQTSMTLDEMLALGGLALKVNREEIRTGVIDEKCTSSWRTETGAQVLIPLRECMRQVRDYTFGVTEGLADVTVEEESATIAVLNGTEVPGLASSAARLLVDHELQVTQYGNADRQDYTASVIILNRPKPATAEQIRTLFGLPESALVSGANPTATQDIVVILGSDYEPSATAATEPGSTAP